MLHSYTRVNLCLNSPSGPPNPWGQQTHTGMGTSRMLSVLPSAATCPSASAPGSWCASQDLPSLHLSADGKLREPQAPCPAAQGTIACVWETLSEGGACPVSTQGTGGAPRAPSGCWGCKALRSPPCCAGRLSAVSLRGPHRQGTQGGMVGPRLC